MPKPRAIDESTYAGRFAANLLRLRTKARLTGIQAADAISSHGYAIKWRTYFAWEQGEREPPLDALPAIARALRVSIRSLFPPE